MFKSGIDIFKDTVDPLLGKAPDKELVNDIYEYVLSFDQVLGIHDFMLHDYGPGRQYMTFHAEVDCHEDIMTVHDQIDVIERDLLESGTPEWRAYDLAYISKAYKGSDKHLITSDIEDLLGRPARSVKDFLSDHLSTFKN